LLIVSARITDQDREKALIQGINEFIQKPFDKKELVLRISNLIESKDNRQEFDDIAARQNLEGVGKEILKKIETYIKDNIEDTNLGVLQLGDAIAASERQVYRLIKKVTGKTPYEYITEVRLQYADYLIRKNMVRSASETARSVGIKNVTTFNRQYQKRFGKKPAELLE
jgi:transcriptional regulator GlxA family with amidase domain